MGRTFHIAVLDLKGCLAGVDIHREQSLHKNLVFSPVYLIFDINAGCILINADVLTDYGIQIIPGYFQAPANRAALCCLYPGHVIDLPGFFRVVIVQIPGVIIVGPVLIAHEHIGGFPFR